MRNEDGSVYYVDKNLDYKAWKEKYVDNNPKKEYNEKKESAKRVISKSDLTPEQKKRAIEVWEQFQKDEVDVSGHFVEQFARREFNKKEERQFDYDDILQITKLEATHVDKRNGNEIVRDGDMNIIRNNGKYISIRKGRVSKQWKEV